MPSEVRPAFLHLIGRDLSANESVTKSFAYLGESPYPEHLLTRITQATGVVIFRVAQRNDFTAVNVDLPHGDDGSEVIWWPPMVQYWSCGRTPRTQLFWEAESQHAIREESILTISVWSCGERELAKMAAR